jgi:hypothetical protein
MIANGTPPDEVDSIMLRRKKARLEQKMTGEASDSRRKRDYKRDYIEMVANGTPPDEALAKIVKMKLAKRKYSAKALAERENRFDRLLHAGHVSHGDHVLHGTPGFNPRASPEDVVNPYSCARDIDYTVQNYGGCCFPTPGHPVSQALSRKCIEAQKKRELHLDFLLASNSTVAVDDSSVVGGNYTARGDTLLYQENAHHDDVMHWANPDANGPQNDLFEEGSNYQDWTP